MSGATSITVRVPMAIRKRGGRKIIVSPDGAVLPGAQRQTTTTADPALLKALARAHGYRRILDEGPYASISELAIAEKLDRSFLSKLLGLTLLAPHLVEAILEGHSYVTLPTLLRPFPASWAEQEHELGDGCSPASLRASEARG